MINQRTFSLLGLAVALFMASLGFSSCSDTEVTPSVQVATLRTNFSPDQTAGWLYYSFDKDSIVDPSKANGADWDIKFRYTPFDTTQQGIGRFVAIYTNLGPIFFNSGTVNSGGQTQAVIVNSAFESVTNPSLYTVRNDDTSKTGRIIPISLGTSDFFIYNGTPGTTQHTVTANPAKTIVIKTKSNKFVKMQLLSIYKDAPTTPTRATPTNFYTFRYLKF